MGPIEKGKHRRHIPISLPVLSSFPQYFTFATVQIPKTTHILRIILKSTIKDFSTTIGSICEENLGNILARLPASSFAFSACVSRSWNRVCDRILCRPKLSSACSFNPSLHEAVEEVVNKVLSEPIRPHFDIVSIGPDRQRLDDAHLLITSRLSSKVPIITHLSRGVIGRDAFSNDFVEVLPTYYKDDGAIMLMVGFLPGMKVKKISLHSDVEGKVAVKIDKFITDIREFSSSVSGSESPAAVIIFGKTWELKSDLPTITEKIDCAMSQETVVVGNCCSDFRHGPRSSTAIGQNLPTGVALVFVMDRNKPSGIGETQFHVALSSGMLPDTPAYQVASIQKVSVVPAISVLATNEDLGDLSPWTGFGQGYIGVTKPRLDSIGQEKLHVSFHEISGRAGTEECVVNGYGIRSGDTFRMYHTSPVAAFSSVANISNYLRCFKQMSDDKPDVFGGLIFTYWCQGKSFLGQPNVVTSAFLENFPGVTLGGSFCPWQFGRGYLTPYVDEAHEQNPVSSCVCEFGVVYLIMSYIP